MKSHLSFAQTLFACAAACLLAACGSDDNKPEPQPNSSSTPELDEYVGLWQADCRGNEVAGYRRRELVISRNDNGNVCFQDLIELFADAECTQKTGSEDKGENVLSLVDRKEVILDEQGVVVAEADVFLAIHKNPDDPEHSFYWWDVFYKKDNMLWWCDTDDHVTWCNIGSEFLLLHKK